MKTAQQYEKEITDALKDDTGKDLNDWLNVLKNSAIGKRNDLLKWLKTEHGLNHGRANILVAIHFNDGKLVYQNAASLKDGWFAKKEHLRTLYDEIEKFIMSIDREVKLTEKKMYMSFNGKREFAVASVKSKEIRLGMDVGDRPFDEYLQPAKSLGAMPRISHMVVINDRTDLTGKLKDLLTEAYDHVHK